MTADQRLLVIGIYINSALYLMGVFVEGLLTAHPNAWRYALVAAGLSYLSYVMQVASVPRTLCAIVVCISFSAGAAAGILLLF